ncbi:MFS transporter [Actinokineospora pegani]|uniref:MFS transporter n=1 Tax=Actinokineospora pegani TaxID=2654637 RepID=UPI0012EAB866|nr:MFS transporter [Actinokineospora pegani]
MGILRRRTYRHLLGAQLVALVGTGLATVALGLLAYDLAGVGAGAVLGGALAVKMVANVVVAPVAAVLTRRMPRRALLVGLDLVRAAVAAALPFVTSVWQVFALVTLLQVASAAFTPAFQALIPTVLPDERDYTRALSFSRLAYDLEGIVSPVLAAALLTVVSFSGLFAGTAFGFLVSAALVLGVRLPETDRTGSGQVTRGIRQYLRTPRLRAQLGLNLAAAAAGSMVLVNTVVLVRGDLGLGDTAVAVGLGAFGAGSMLAALTLPRVLTGVPDRVVVLTGAGVLGAALFALAALYATAPALPTVLIGWLVLGTAYSLVLTPVGRLIRRSAEERELPALFAAQFALSHAGWLVTYLLAGALGAALSPPWTMAALGVVAVGGLAFGARTWTDRPQPVAAGV